MIKSTSVHNFIYEQIIHHKTYKNHTRSYIALCFAVVKALFALALLSLQQICQDKYFSRYRYLEWIPQIF